MSKSIESILNYSPEAIYSCLQQPAVDSNLQHILHKLTDKFAELDFSKEHPAREIEVSTKKGNVCQLLLSEILLFDASNELQGIYGIAIDTTHHYVAEQELAINERRLKLAERLARFGHWNLNLVTGELLWSEEIYTIFGLKKEEFDVSYEAFLSCVPTDDRDIVRNRVNGAVKSRECCELEHRIIRQSDNEMRMVHEFCEFICDDEGKPVRAIGVIQDVTEYRKSELERFNRDRTRYTSLIETIDAIATTLAFRDPYTAGHQKQVARLAVRIGQELGLDDKTLEGVRLGAMLHDIGKVKVPMEILNRPGRLSKPEYEIIKTHAEVGYEIVEKVEFIWPIKEMIAQHHERLDGSGYPFGLSGDEIILEARIIAVADVFDAVTSHRPYRPARGFEKAMEVLEQGRGSAFDAQIVDICIGLVKANAPELAPVEVTII